MHDSMTRWYTVHGTHGLLLARNVGYLSIGHGYFIDGGPGRDRAMGVRGKDVCVNVERRRSCK